MTSDNNDAEELRDDESIQDALRDAFPDLPDHRVTDAPEDEADVTMSMDEQRAINDALDEFINGLYQKGFTANEVSIVLQSHSRRVNAERFDKHEYDRIALSLRLRQSISEWEAEQETDIPERVIAETVEELGRYYRTIARKNHDTNDSDDDSEDTNTQNDATQTET